MSMISKCRNMDFPCEEPDHDDRRDHSAVKCHPAIPGFDNLQRVGEVVTRLVKDHVAQTPANDDRQRHVEDEIAELWRGEMGRVTPEPLVAQERVSVEGTLRQEHRYRRANTSVWQTVRLEPPDLSPAEGNNRQPCMGRASCLPACLAGQILCKRPVSFVRRI